MPKPPSDLLDTQVTPDPASDKRQHRSFTIEDKKRILAEAEACQERGELGALLRRENIYSSQLQSWRRQLAAQGEAGLHNALPGRKPSTDAKDREIEMLRRQKAQLELQKNPPRRATSATCSTAPRHATAARHPA